MSAQKIVFFDLETGGVQDHHPDIQLAAIAINESGGELETFERKIEFQDKDADPQALAMNHYDPLVWADEAKQLVQVRAEFSAFLKRHACIQMVSKRTGAPYSVALLGGYNAATFDGPRLKRMYATEFLPAHPRVLCVLQRALWFSQETQTTVADFKLGTVAAALGVECADAHDALADVRTTIAVMLAIRSKSAVAA